MDHLLFSLSPQSFFYVMPCYLVAYCRFWGEITRKLWIIYAGNLLRQDIIVYLHNRKICASHSSLKRNLCSKRILFCIFFSKLDKSLLIPNTKYFRTWKCDNFPKIMLLYLSTLLDNEPLSRVKSLIYHNQKSFFIAVHKKHIIQFWIVRSKFGFLSYQIVANKGSRIFTIENCYIFHLYFISCMCNIKHFEISAL